MAPKRTRFGLDGDGVRQLAAVLSPYVDKAGWIRYGEDMKKGQVCAKTILSKKMIVALKELSENLCFTKMAAQRALKDILRIKKDKLDVRDTEEEGWVSSCAARLRVMLRHVHTSMKKKPRTKWVDQLFGEGPAIDAECPAEEEEHEQASGVDAAEPSTLALMEPPSESRCEAATEYLYGWSKELQCAYRKPANHKGSVEFALETLMPPEGGGTVHDCQVRRWHD